MPGFQNPRIIVTKNPALSPSPVVSHQLDDQNLTGVWSKPQVPNLIFADSTHDGTRVPYNNGPVGGVGTPVQLIFWGRWWSAEGKQRRILIESWTQDLLKSPYFSELAQYHIAIPPQWRGSSLVVTKPGPPGRVSWKEASRKTLDLIDDLIDDDRLPDPDDGPRIAFIVLMPPGFSVVDPVLGAHSADYDWDFPFDTDNYWAGWVRYFPPPEEERTMEVLSHELVEILTDPELNAWHTNPYHPSSEIADWSQSIISGRSVKQIAWVNGVRVQSYWSNDHSATVIPIDRDYAAQIAVTVKEVRRRVAAMGTFRPDPEDSSACSEKLPECCIDDRDYAWTVYSITETANVRLNTVRYRAPKAEWSVQGIPVTGAGTLSLTVSVDGFNGRNPTTSAKAVAVQYVATDLGLDLTVSGSGGNFDIAVECTVVDNSIVGNLSTNVIASPRIAFGFVGAECAIDPSYKNQLSACYTAMVRRYTEIYAPLGAPRPGDPINYDLSILHREIPAYARLSEYQQIRETAKVIRAADHLLPAESARLFINQAVRHRPALFRGLNQGNGQTPADLMRVRREDADSIQDHPAT